MPQFNMYRQDSIIRMQKVKIQSDYISIDPAIPLKPQNIKGSPLKKAAYGPNSNKD